MPVWSRRCIGGGGLGPSGLGLSGQLFGIHRYRSESELGFATEHRRRRGRKTKIAVGVVIASMASLFICLLVLDMTQTSEAFHPPEAQTQKPLSTPRDQSNSLNVTTPVNATEVKERSLPAKEPKTLEQGFKSTIVGGNFLTLAQHGFPIPRTSPTPFMPQHQEDVDLTEEPSTTTDVPTSAEETDYDSENSEEEYDSEDDENSTAGIPTAHPNLDKKTGWKSARSLPEDRARAWPGTFSPVRGSDGSVNGKATRQAMLEALPSIGQEVGLPQWNDMQKRSGIPLPTFDANKWLDAFRYQADKNPSPWPNRAADPSRSPRPFHQGADTSQNQQLLVVNNRGVVIPNSVQFPDVVKSAAYPQLQTYRYPQTSRNIQDILRYMTSSTNNNPVAVAANRLRQNQWPQAVKKAAKVSSMYAAPTDVYTNTYVPTRPEAAFLAATAATTPVGVKPLNGHAYISDPFHPYKPADPTEINHLAASDYSSGYSDSDASNSFVFPTKSSKQAHLRSHFSTTKQPQIQGQSNSYTSAVFKPMGNPDQLATSTGTVDSTAQQQKRILPPLSVTLEIYPMANDDTRTVPFRGMTASQSFRRPSQVNTNPSVTYFQKDAPARRPVSLAVDASPASSAMNVPVLAPSPYPPQGPPAFGMTLAGLPPLPGMAASDSKHRMVVHLNFYPKKNSPSSAIVPRFREPTDDYSNTMAGMPTTAAGGMFTGDFPQRRQSNRRKTNNGDSRHHIHGRKGTYFTGNPVVQAEFDASTLANVLPRDVVQHFSEIFRTYQAATPHDPEHHNTYEIASDDGEYAPDMSPGDRGDHNGYGLPEDQEELDDESSDDDEDDEDDEEEGRVVPYPEEMRRNILRRGPPMLRGMERARLPLYRSWRPDGDVPWADVQDDDENEGVVEEVQTREAEDRSESSKLTHEKTKTVAYPEPTSTSTTTTTTTSTTTETPELERQDQLYKPRRRLIIEVSPKNHRMQ